LDMEEFEFVAWTQEWELEESTVKALIDNGFKSYKSLVRLNDDKLRKLFAKTLSPGQYGLLEAGLEILQPEKAPRQPEVPTEAPTTAPETPAPEVPAPTPSVPAATTSHPQFGLQELLGLQEQDTSRYGYHHSGEVATDPFCFGTGPFAAKKLRTITDYITHTFASTHTDQTRTVVLNGVEVEVARPPKLDTNKIGVAHYMEGALRIIREMILEDSLPLQQVVNHLNYLIQVSCLAQSNSWQRVLAYDTTYRREQFAHGFPWGTTSAFLLNAQLTTPTSGPQKQSEHPRNARPNISNPDTGKIICFSWNARSGCQRPNCRYDHVCAICHASTHNQAQHDAQGKN
jgi:hypothetical protein